MSAKAKFQKHQAELLRQQTIGPEGPGTILHDFQALIEFIGPEGVRTTGKYHFLPIDRLFELDARMAKPLRPPLSRPQQKSFPHLHALYLLLRTTELAVPQGEGKKTGRLVPNPPMLEQWWALNDTEKYFNLLEVGLLWASLETLGERAAWSNRLLFQANSLWFDIPARGLDSRQGDDPVDHLIYSTDRSMVLALLELFGLVEIETGEPAKGKTWPVVAVRRTAFGEALLDLLFEYERTRGFGAFEEEDGGEERDCLGVWQSLLAEYFPEWRKNLCFPQREFRHGVFYFKASLGTVWRRIAIPAEKTLEELAWAIIGGFGFDGDHLYQFRFREQDGTITSATRPEVDLEEGDYTDERSIGYLPLEEGQEMEFHYDFGANWQFRVKLEKIEPASPDIEEAIVVESHGEAPEEYGGYDEDDWE